MYIDIDLVLIIDIKKQTMFKSEMKRMAAKIIKTVDDLVVVFLVFWIRVKIGEVNICECSTTKTELY